MTDPQERCRATNPAMVRCELPAGHSSEFHRAGDAVWLVEQTAWEERLEPQPGSIADDDE